MYFDVRTTLCVSGSSGNKLNSTCSCRNLPYFMPLSMARLLFSFDAVGNLFMVLNFGSSTNFLKF